MPVSQIADLVEAGVANTTEFKRKVRCFNGIASIILLSWWNYAWLALYLGAGRSRSGGPYWLAVAFKASEFYYNISSFAQRAVTELADHGYAWRAEEVSLIYFSNIFFFIAWGLMLFSGFIFFYSIRQVSIFRWSLTRTSVSSVVFFVFGLLGHIFLNWFTISWSGENFGFYLDMIGRNQGIIKFCFVEAGATLGLSVSYHLAVAARILTILKDRASQSETAASSGESANTCINSNNNHNEQEWKK